MKQIGKILGCAGLLGLYWLCGGFDPPPTSTGLFRLCITINSFFLVGAVGAFWGGGEPIGILYPVSLRAIFIVLGTLMMVGAFVAMLAMREDIAHWLLDTAGAAQPSLPTARTFYA